MGKGTVQKEQGFRQSFENKLTEEFQPSKTVHMDLGLKRWQCGTSG